ncbi:MAG: hypothetical protein HY304_08220 [candidate division Zixibacteria bacterium]|nr:hypothetical protein [candidate division Zixibacteria bacterium]
MAMGAAKALGSGWRSLGLSVVVVAVVVGSSIGLVRLRNRHRAVTPAILWAADAIAAIPDSLAAGSFPIDGFAAGRQRFVGQLRSGTLPVDSVRAFYLAYSLWARDGCFSADDVRALGQFLGLLPESPDRGAGKDTLP